MIREVNRIETHGAAHNALYDQKLIEDINSINAYITDVIGYITK